MLPMKNHNAKQSHGTRPMPEKQNDNHITESLDQNERFSRNYQVIKSQVILEGYNGVLALKETNRRVREKGSQITEDLRPVSFEEGLNIFNEYYKDKGLSDKQASKKKQLDFKRRKNAALMPGSNQSYLYRNKPHAKKSGPELYDMIGVDDNPQNLVGTGMPMFNDSSPSSFKPPLNKS